ncbi:NADPH-dependent FMN reductase [Streptomyces radicis]|uniref:NADPH-dependent oxidoreductase n=1 Tax=Streptomyces radicis TaxID=1750517 RepID=A0A3A9WF44_9ACTN|nr:NAD(P)H-dependent oxidoreductase [Streptomyces radicis]RKN11400.1 NADPH-dependent oxidoreductase [Streptomyces radicis]RKN26581.1 NADPH-dependent oxidoreductase [Streptomyces radicis]
MVNGLRVAVIIGSTRQGRAGGAIGQWFTAHARRRDDVEVAVLDLVDFAFPARYPDEPTPAMRRFAAAVERAEAFVVVTPEYNRSFPASLKQAIDAAYDEWHAKPVGFVSYGLHSYGTCAVEALRGVFAELHTVTVRDVVGIDLLVDAERRTESQARAATALLDQLVWWGMALREARARRPYVT